MNSWNLHYTADSPKIPWQNEADKKYLKGLVGQDLTSFFHNLKTTYLLAEDGNIVLPLTLNQIDYGNCYLCSPYDYYISYGQEEVISRAFSALKLPIQGVFFLLSRLLRSANINRAIVINNWLFSTNLYPEISKEQLISLLQTLRQHFPSHALIFRSLDSFCHAEKIAALKEAGCRIIPFRKVYFTDTTDNYPLHARMNVSDHALAKKSPYIFENVTDSTTISWERMEDLYRKLYIEKHSKYNLDLTAAFLKHSFDSDKIQFGILKHKEQINGMIGYYRSGKVITAPYFGYDTTRSKEEGLYRLLSYYLLDIAKREGALLHHSSGADEFKKIRRAEGYMEYMAVDTNHLPRGLRTTWNSLDLIMNNVGSKIITADKK